MKRRELTTVTEMEIVDFLDSDAVRPMQVYEIASSIGRNSRNCSKTLKSLAERGVIVKSVEFGKTFYASTSKVHTSASKLPTSASKLPTSTPQAKTSPNRVTTPEGAGKVAVVISSVAPAPVFAKKSQKSHTCTCSSYSINQREIAKKKKTQAAVSPPPPCPDPLPSGYRFGILFPDPSRRTRFESLYIMGEMMAGKKAPDPDSHPKKPRPPIPMEEAFEKLVKRGYEYVRKWKNPLRDFILHRIAFLFVYDEDFVLGDNTTFDYCIEEYLDQAKRENPECAYNWILADLGSKYTFREWGWDRDSVGFKRESFTNEDVWDYELLKKGKKGARRGLFPMRWHYAKKRTTSPAPPDEQLRIDPPPGGSGVSVHPVLVRIAERLGKRFDVWFEGVVFYDDGGTPVFEVRNKFKADSIRRHCSAEIEQVLLDHYGKAVLYDVKVRAPPVGGRSQNAGVSSDMIEQTRDLREPKYNEPTLVSLPTPKTWQKGGDDL